MKKLIAIFGLMALAACGGDDAGETETTSSDTASAVIQGQDTVPTVVPTTDTATTVTTTTTTTDTTQGQAQTGTATTDTAAH